MHALRNVLAASDLSTASPATLARAAMLCREHGAHLEVLHVIEELPPAALLSSEAALGGVREALAAAAEKASGEGIDWAVEVATGKDFVAIIRHARSSHTDLIVIGAHGHHQLRDYLLGTTAEKLIRKAPLPVLTVRQPPQQSYRRLLVPTDFSSAARQALLAASRLAPGAAIDLLHVYGFWGEGRLSMAGADSATVEQYRQQRESWARETMAEWREGVDLSGHRVEEHYHQGHTATVICEFADIHRHDLVAMGTSGRSGLPYILLGSVTENVLRGCPCDTLTVRPLDFHFELP